MKVKTYIRSIADSPEFTSECVPTPCMNNDLLRNNFNSTICKQNMKLQQFVAAHKITILKHLHSTSILIMKTIALMSL